MTIEMTTFAVPTILVEAAALLVLCAAIWAAVVIVGVTIYWFTVGPKK